MRLDITNLKQEDCLDSFFALLANLLENSVNATQALQVQIYSLYIAYSDIRLEPSKLSDLYCSAAPTRGLVRTRCNLFSCCWNYRRHVQSLCKAFFQTCSSSFVSGPTRACTYETRITRCTQCAKAYLMFVQVVLNVIKANPVYCRRVFGVEFILDALRHVDNTESTDPEAGMLDTAGGLINLLQFYFEVCLTHARFAQVLL